MRRPMVVSGSVIIDAPADAIYAQVSDPTHMGRWSPENLGATVRDPAVGSYAGMTFDGHNKRGRLRWTTRCTVTAADPGRRFAFRVHAIGLRRPFLPARIATWEYAFAPEGGSTRVTETWTDDRRGWPDAVAGAFDRVATSGSTFADFQRRNIAKTLANLKAALETR